MLRLIAQGYTYKEIARELFISGKTVESHVSSVLRKLQLSSRHQLTRWAAERRLTRPGHLAYRCPRPVHVSAADQAAAGRSASGGDPVAVSSSRRGSPRSAPSRAT